MFDTLPPDDIATIRTRFVHHSEEQHSRRDAGEVVFADLQWMQVAALLNALDEAQAEIEQLRDSS